MKRLQFLLISFLFCYPTIFLCQGDLTGYWHGYLTQGNSSFYYSMNLDQNGNGLVGYSHIKSRGSSNYGLINLSGTLNGTVFNFQYGSVISQQTNPGSYWCSIYGNLVFDSTKNMLKGHWESTNCGNSGADTIYLWRLDVATATDFCEEDTVEILVNGTNTIWYSDSTLGTIIATGNRYLSAQPVPTTVYVTQVINGLETSGYPVDITIHPNPQISLGPDIAFQPGVPQILNAQIPGMISYQWSTGDTSSAIIVNDPGVYIVNVSNEFGCTGTDTVIVEGTVRIDQEQNPYISISPNPASEIITVKGLQGGATSISISDPSGKVVDEFRWDRENKNKAIKHLPAGVYILRWQNGYSSGYKKFIKTN